MTEGISAFVAFLTDVERLKLVKRRAYVSDMPRPENAAEHSWHLALGLVVVAQELNLQLDMHKALMMALIHEVCEVDARDRPAFGPHRPDQHEAELRCIERLAASGTQFGTTLRELWLEYEAQVSPERPLGESSGPPHALRRQSCDSRDQLAGAIGESIPTAARECLARCSNSSAGQAHGK
jgi:hypothetical protein